MNKRMEAEMNFFEFMNARAKKQLKAQERVMLAKLAEQVDKARWAYCAASDLKHKVSLVVVK